VLAIETSHIKNAKDSRTITAATAFFILLNIVVSSCGLAGFCLTDDPINRL
jgi:hypothetical protein